MKTIFILTMSWMLFQAAIIAQEVPVQSPYDNDFIRYLNDVKTGKNSFTTQDGHSMGLIPVPVKSHSPVSWGTATSCPRTP